MSSRILKSNSLINFKLPHLAASSRKLLRRLNVVLAIVPWNSLMTCTFYRSIYCKSHILCRIRGKSSNNLCRSSISNPWYSNSPFPAFSSSQCKPQLNNFNKCLTSSNTHSHAPRSPPTISKTYSSRWWCSSSGPQSSNATPNSISSLMSKATHQLSYNSKDYGRSQLLHSLLLASKELEHHHIAMQGIHPMIN